MNFLLKNDQIREHAARAVLDAPAGYVVEIKPESNTAAQRRYMWDCLGKIARTPNETMGRLIYPDQWKAGFMVDLGREQEIIATPLGKWFPYYDQRSSKLDKKMYGDLISSIRAYAHERGIRIKEPDDQGRYERNEG